MNSENQRTNMEMRVTKRNGQLEDISFDKILNRVKKIGQEANIQINYSSLAMKVIDQLYDGIPTTKIDELTCEQCAALSTMHPDYGVLAGRIFVSNHQKNTSASFYETMSKLYHFTDIHGAHSPLISHETWITVEKNSDELDAMIHHNRDYLLEYFGLKTLERAYLFRVNDVIVERPQHMWMRVAVGIHADNLDAVKETYDLMSQKYFTHATPTLFNAGTPRPQLSSCYLIAMEEDSLDGIFNTLKDCASISKWAGGIGLHIHNIRAKNTHIRGTNGKSNGIVPMLRVFNDTARYVDQCVVPKTYIYTTTGPIQIQNCVSDETSIINITGGTEVIQNVLEHDYNGEMLKIKTTHSIDDLQITPEHPLYVLRNNPKGTNYNIIHNKLVKKHCAPEWIDAKDLTCDDLLIYSIPTYEKDVPSISEDDCYMYGIILGDGCLYERDDAGYVCLHTFNKASVQEFLVQYLESKCINYRIQVDDNTTKIRWNKTNNLPFRHADVYDENKKKRLQHKWLNLPVNKCKYILKGLIDTDGCKGKELVFDSTSRNLVESVRYICLKMGILTSGYIRDRIGEKHETKRGVIENKQLSYSLRIPRTREICDIIKVDYNDNQFFKFFKYENYLMTRVKNIEKTEYNGVLYDLQMKTEHNYLLHNCLVHNGGGRRNGSFAIYLEPWHPDIEDFLEMKKNHGDEEMRARDLFYALWTPDLFMERVKANAKWSLFCPHECPGLADAVGAAFKTLYEKYESDGKSRKTVNARDLWFKVLDAQMETGTPYILFKDAANLKSNQKNLGTIKSSNLCVAPETQILTDKGYHEIQSLVNQKVNVWNGEEFSEVTVQKTGENQDLLRVETSDGCILDCTPYHKFYIQNKYNNSKSNPNKNFSIVEAQNLKEGDKIIKCEYPIIEGKDDIKYAYTHGFFCGDGTYNNNNCELPQKCSYAALLNHSYCKRHIDFENESNCYPIQTENTDYKCNGISYLKKPMVSLYGEKKDLLKYMDYRTVENEDATGRLNICLPLDINDKFDVPINGSLKNKLDWFSGYCDADGTIANNGDNQQLQIASIKKDFLMQIKFMLNTCGVQCKINKSNKEGMRKLPDSNRVLKEYYSQQLYRLLITSYDLRKLKELGFSPKRLKINDVMPNRSACQFIKISSVTITGRKDDTYCFTEHKKHAGIFNGIITSQCTEIIEYSDDKETAVCNLASIALPAFVDETTKQFNYDKLHEVTKVVTSNLNRVIDINFYPTEKTRRSNLLHRPIGIGVQGLADAFIMMDIAFHSDEAKIINKLIFETIYHAALERSNEIAIEIKNNTSSVSDHSTIVSDLCLKYSLSGKHRGAYKSFEGSPASQGILQFDMWNVEPSTRYDWAELKYSIMEHGIRNSLLLAPMPTASTSQILGYNECFEPLTSNIYSRRTLAGEFVLANKYLMKELIDLGQWNEKIKNNIIANKGSIQQLTMLSEHIRNKYKIVWEMPMKHLIDMSADRGAFICQSQSLNLWLEDPNYNTLTSMHFYSWKQGLKTGIYYLRRKGKHQAQQFTLEPEKNETINAVEDEHDICEMCSA